MMLEVVDHLTEIVRQALEVDRSGHGGPSEMEMRLLVVRHLGPEVRASLMHHSLDKLGVVAVENLILKHSSSLRLGQELVGESTCGHRWRNL